MGGYCTAACSCLSSSAAWDGLLCCLQLRQVETEAKHDVKARAGRRSRKLEQSLVWLLVVSCAVASVEVAKKFMLLWSKYDQGDDSRDHEGSVMAQPAPQL